MTDQTVEFIEETYDLGFLRFNDEIIPGKSVKVSGKIKAERQTVSNAHHGVGWNFSEEEYSGEVSEIPIKHWSKVKERWHKQKYDPLGLMIPLYNIVDEGQYKEMAVLKYAVITDFDLETEGKTTFSCKFESLTMKE